VSVDPFIDDFTQCEVIVRVNVSLLVSDFRSHSCALVYTKTIIPFLAE